jgi:hypothetical protein
MLFSELPDKYEFDYLVYSVADGFLDQERLWDEDIVELTQRQLFKMFDSYVEREFYNKEK